MEAIVTGPKPGARASLRSFCFDTGQDGDANQQMVLAGHGRHRATRPKIRAIPGNARLPISKPLPPVLIARVETSSPDFVVSFTEDKKGFYINGRKYSPLDPPMTTVTIGAFHHWRITNDSHEVHPFHIHQVHFMYAQNGILLQRPEWLIP